MGPCAQTGIWGALRAQEKGPYIQIGGGGKYSGKEAVCEMGGCACELNVYVDWGMRVWGRLGNRCADLGACA